MMKVQKKNNIVLIGFMGTGKSAAGTTIAAKMRLRFIETDRLIVQTAGKSIPEIFQEDGEIVFREYEIAAVKSLAHENGVVIAGGGGIVLNHINIDRLKQHGVIVLLKASPQRILQRTGTEGGRPLLNGERETQARQLLKFRRPFYERAADITINTSGLNVDQVAKLIIEKLKNYAGFNFPQ